MKITTTVLKPRNPLVAPAHFRRAGLLLRNGEHHERVEQILQPIGRQIAARGAADVPPLGRFGGHPALRGERGVPC